MLIATNAPARYDWHQQVGTARTTDPLLESWLASSLATGSSQELRVVEAPSAWHAATQRDRYASGNYIAILEPAFAEYGIEVVR